MSIRQVTPAETVEGLSFCIVAARWNEGIVRRLLAGALDVLSARGVADADIEVRWVPGSFELPLAARWAAAAAAPRRFAAVIALGCVIRGDTAHFEYVAGECARGLQQVMLTTGVPIAFGVLTTENLAQAQQRAGPGAHNKGAEALQTALVMARLLRSL